MGSLGEVEERAAAPARPSRCAGRSSAWPPAARRTSRVAEALGSEVNGGAAELLRDLDESTLRDLLALLAERKKGR